jgi:bacterioferritin
MKESDLIEGLNRDLAQELGAICRAIQQTALARGTASHELRVLLNVEIIDDVFHALFLAEKIAALGGIPTVTPVPYPENLTDARAMVEYDLAAEHQAILQYTERLEEATATWSIGLKSRLERILAEETAHEEGLRSLKKQSTAESMHSGKGHGGLTHAA